MEYRQRLKQTKPDCAKEYYDMKVHENKGKFDTEIQKAIKERDSFKRQLEEEKSKEYLDPVAIFELHNKWKVAASKVRYLAELKRVLFPKP